MAKGDTVDCDMCRDLYGGKCAREDEIIVNGALLDCNIPILLPDNRKALGFWQLLSKFDRAAGFSGIESISSASIRDFCSDYDETWETYDKILVIEGEFINKWREEQKKKDKNKEKSKVNQNRAPKKRRR